MIAIIRHMYEQVCVCAAWPAERVSHESSHVDCVASQPRALCTTPAARHKL